MELTGINNMALRLEILKPSALILGPLCLIILLTTLEFSELSTSRTLGFIVRSTIASIKILNFLYKNFVRWYKGRAKNIIKSAILKEIDYSHVDLLLEFIRVET